ncbi:M50 family metallopeptidase [Schaalia suimastitidis]|uniref:M50 family metallopeptidase n=1 Tax=Schaalia suimastitidis TaxID=121163 RepID=UPI0003F94DED|nr:M50 family metallopeptidase [Schaalia suimastitidis]
MSSLWGILAVIVGLLVSVAVHELGHMYFAKRFGVPVPEYSIGFGPKLWSTSWRGTQYSFRAIPLGGYVRIPGMFAPAKAGTRLTRNNGRLTLAQEARVQSASELPAGTEHRAFYRLSAPKKFLIMFAGPATNLILCVILAATAMIGIGYRSATTEIAEVLPTVTTASGSHTQSPASAAGLMAGDRVLEVDGVAITSWSQFQHAIADTSVSTKPSIEVLVDRQGQHLKVTLTPVRVSDETVAIGVRSGTEYRPATLGQVGQTVVSMARDTAALVARLPMSVWNVATSLVTDEPRERTGLVSVVGVGRIAAEVTSGDASSLGITDVRQSASVLLMLVASLNMALFIFNLLPLPPLDGGHILGAIYEGTRRQVAKLRGADDPGPADTARLMPLTYTVATFFIGMTLILVLADIFNPITLG